MTVVPPNHELPPAGWYPDPAGTPQERWWGGVEWTDHLRPVVAPVAAPPASAYANPFAAEPAEQPASQFVDTLERPVGYQPMGGWSESATWETRTIARTGSPNTLPIWLLAFSSPILTVTILGIALLLRGLQAFLPVFAGSVVVIFCLGIACIFWDNAILNRRGLSAASPVWMLLGLLVYFIARAVVLRRSGVSHWAPVIVFLAVQASFYFVGNVFGLLNEARGETIAQVEEAIEDQLVRETPQEWQVTCPADASTTVRGTSFVCDGLGADGTAVHVLVTVEPDGFLSLQPAQ